MRRIRAARRALARFSGSFTLGIQNASQAVDSDVLSTISQERNLGIQNAAQAHASGSISLSETNLNLGIQNGTQTHDALSLILSMNVVESEYGLRGSLQRPALSPIVTLFVLDASAIGGSVTRFHAGVNGLGADVVWNGETYVKWPIDASGFEWTTKGAMPMPKLIVSNVDGSIGALCRMYDDLVGARLTRRRTLLKYLDAINFPGNVNPTADPTAILPDDVYYIQRKSRENKQFVEFELSPSFDVTGIMLPLRQVLPTCGWTYRGAECGWTGGMYDVNDVSTADPALDRCSKRKSGCKVRFGENAELPYGGFPNIQVYRA